MRGLMQGYRKRKNQQQSFMQMCKPLFHWYVLGTLFLLITFYTKNPLLLFLSATFITSIINYHTNCQTIRYNPDTEVFFSLLLTRTIGLHWAVIMLLVPTLFIDIYTARADKDSLIALVLTIIINIIFSFSTNLPFVPVALLLIVIKYSVGIFLNFLIDISPEELVFEHLLGFVTNIFLILVLGNVMLGLMT